MAWIRNTSKSVEEVVSALEEAVPRHGFGILHTYCFQETLRSKGFDLAHPCRVLEICSPAQAAEVLRADMKVGLALPCRIAVFEDEGGTRVGMLEPTALLKLVSSDPAVAAAAEEVERRMTAIL